VVLEINVHENERFSSESEVVSRQISSPWAEFRRNAQKEKHIARFSDALGAHLGFWQGWRRPWELSKSQRPGQTAPTGLFATDGDRAAGGDLAVKFQRVVKYLDAERFLGAIQFEIVWYPP